MPRWQSESVVTEEEDFSARSLGDRRCSPGFPLGRSGRLSGTRRKTVRVIEAKGKTVRLERTVEFRSRLNER